MVSIVIADDHEVMRRGMRCVLEAHAGWQVSGEAPDGKRAVDVVRELRPRVAVVDLGLPGLGGVEVTRQVRKASPDTEVVICTLRDEEGLAREALCAGARAFVLKSEGAGPLVGAVEAAAAGEGFYSRRFTPAALGCPCGPRSGRKHDASSLTPREREIVQLLAEGKTNHCVSVILGIAVKTVETHRTNVLQKLQLESNVEIAHYAIRNGLVDP
ncbi:MAG TPA: response regulator transcription factor [Anaeromyxobacteraceae bacterium]|nr:response regulator transcription factor [Anaeromyxobacteraceae bacterium]